MSKFMITTKQFGFVMYASAGGTEWSDQLSDAAVYDNRDSRAAKLDYWKAIARLFGYNDSLVVVTEAK